MRWLLQYLHNLFGSHEFVLIDAKARNGYHARCKCGAYLSRKRQKH